MHFPEEITAPSSWQSVRIETAGVGADVVDELVYEIGLTQLRAIEESGAIVVHKGADEIALSSFIDGIVPDLEVRGFRATWQSGI